jgi:two-component system chemotaxis response regulator CheB
MPDHAVVVIGGSAGAVEGVIHLARSLPPDFPGSVLIVIHIPPDAPSALPNLLNRVGPLPAAHPVDGERLQPSRIYVAPPNRHLLMRAGTVKTGDGPRENRHRPSVDALFRSAAQTHGDRVIGVVLSGNLDDGVAGLLEIKRHGGIAVVLDPKDALYDGMPRNAIAAVAGIDHVVSQSRLAQLLTSLARKRVQPAMSAGNERRDEAEDVPARPENPPEGIPSAYSCPDCGGVLWEVSNGELMHYRCRTGHAYSPESLLASQSEGVEDALWAAYRALAETAAQAREIAHRMQSRGYAAGAGRFISRADDAQRRADLIRAALQDLNATEEPLQEAG